MLRDILGKFVIAYINNFIYSPSFESHVNHVKQVLSYLLENQFYVKGGITFLGYVISKEGVTMDKAKVSAVTK